MKDGVRDIGTPTSGRVPVIEIRNQGPLIIATNYWSSPFAAKGLVWCSVNAGAIRVLLPPSAYPTLGDMRAARECILSRGPWPEQGLPDAVELLWDDGSESPFALHLTARSFDLLPAQPEPGREWLLSVWTNEDGMPHKAFERICHWRRSVRLPDLRPWEAAG
jgi:hypothetical protein